MPHDETVAVLLLEEWRNDMKEEIISINHILLTIVYTFDGVDYGDKSEAIKAWITSVLRKIRHYQAEHENLLDEAASTLEILPLSQDIAMNNYFLF